MCVLSRHLLRRILERISLISPVCIGVMACAAKGSCWATKLRGATTFLSRCHLMPTHPRTHTFKPGHVWRSGNALEKTKERLSGH